jgi:hypothetical protein
MRSNEMQAHRTAARRHRTQVPSLGLRVTRRPGGGLRLTGTRTAEHDTHVRRWADTLAPAPATETAAR